jgi:hypothetical protein
VLMLAAEFLLFSWACMLSSIWACLHVCRLRNL